MTTRGRGTAHSRVTGGCGDAGLTLIELLVAIALLGISSTALFAAMQTSIGVGHIYRTQTQAGRILDNFAEYMKNPATAQYAPCPAATAAYAADAAAFMALISNSSNKVYEPAHAHYTLSVTVSAGIVAIPAPADPSMTFPDPSTAAACSAATDSGVQRLTLTVSGTSNDEFETVQIVRVAP